MRRPQLFAQGRGGAGARERKSARALLRALLMRQASTLARDASTAAAAGTAEAGTAEEAPCSGRPQSAARDRRAAPWDHAPGHVLSMHGPCTVRGGSCRGSSSRRGRRRGFFPGPRGGEDPSSPLRGPRRPRGRLEVPRLEGGEDDGAPRSAVAPCPCTVTSEARRVTGGRRRGMRGGAGGGRRGGGRGEGVRGAAFAALRRRTRAPARSALRDLKP